MLLVTASCGSPTWASGCRTVTVDPVFTRDVVEEPCMSMSEATSITVGNINYSYFNVTATGVHHLIPSRQIMLLL